MGFSQKKRGRPSDKAIKERKRRKLRRVLLVLNHLHKLEIDSVDFLLIIQEKSANAYKKVKYVGTGDLRDKFECGQPIFGAETRLYHMGLKGTPTQSSDGFHGLKFFSECTTIGKTRDKCKEANYFNHGDISGMKYTATAQKLVRDKSKVASIQSQSTSTSDEKKTSPSESQLTDSSKSTLTGTESATTIVKAVKAVSIKKSSKKQRTAWLWRNSQCDGESGEESDYTLNSDDDEDDDDDDDDDDYNDFDLDDGGDMDRELVEKVIGDLGNTTKRQDENTAVDKNNQQQQVPPDQSRQDVAEDDKLTELSSTADKTKNLWVVLNTENDQVSGESGPATDKHFENAETNKHTKGEALTPEQQDVIENAVKTSSQQCPAVFAYEQGTWWVVQNASSGHFMMKNAEFDESTKKIATSKLLVSSQEMPTIISKGVAPSQGTMKKSEQVKSKVENVTEKAATTRGDNSSMQPYVLRKSTRKRAYRKLIEYTPSKKKNIAENETMQNSSDQNSEDPSSSIKLLSTTGEESVTKSLLHKKVPSLNINQDMNDSTSLCAFVQSSPQLNCSTPSQSSPSTSVQQVKDVMFMMNQFMSIQQQQFQEEIDQRERMHSDRMSVFKGLVDTLKFSMEKGEK